MPDLDRAARQEIRDRLALGDVVLRAIEVEAIQADA